MEQLCSLQVAKAVELMKDRQQVYYKHGVWNQYERKIPPMLYPEFKIADMGLMFGKKMGNFMSAFLPMVICGEEDMRCPREKRPFDVLRRSYENGALCSLDSDSHQSAG